ncbi:MAG: methylated-DNA--[protein]-cysteine S-methyltransferase [Hominimerdicola sp.]
MLYRTNYNSPIGKLILMSNETELIGVWLEGMKCPLRISDNDISDKGNVKILWDTKRWLHRYFSGEKPHIGEISLNPNGSDFQKLIWKLLCEIPYGKTVTYGELADKAAKIMNKKSMSAQAVGGAVGKNPILIIIPCHRVIGKNGSLTGYAGGVEKKLDLLKIEKSNLNLHIAEKIL